MRIFPHKIDINFVKLQYSIFKTLCNHDRKERIPFKRRIINVKKRIEDSQIIPRKKMSR